MFYLVTVWRMALKAAVDLSCLFLRPVKVKLVLLTAMKMSFPFSSWLKKLSLSFALRVFLYVS